MLTLLLVTATQLWLALPTSSNELVNLTQMFGPSPRAYLPFPELVKYDGFNSETHNVTTEDGYILTMHRVLPSGQPIVGPPIVFFHGLYLCSDSCIIPGPGKAHCYLYSKSGYDVWVPNVRGNRYSRGHINCTINDPEFWDFTFDDMAQKDLPAILDYIKKVTGQEQVYYVGHSQGFTMLLGLCAKQPEYNQRFKRSFGLSPAAWLTKSKLAPVWFQGALSPVLTPLVNNGVNGEIFAYGGLIQTLAKYLCGLTTVSYPLCSLLIFALFGYNGYNVSNETLPVAVGHEPSGTSLKNFNYWGQIYDKGFTMYNLSQVTTHITIAVSRNDYVCDLEDLEKTTKYLKNSEICILSCNTFGHIDHIYGDTIPKYLMPIISTGIEEDKFLCT